MAEPLRPIFVLSSFIVLTGCGSTELEDHNRMLMARAQQLEADNESLELRAAACEEELAAVEPDVEEGEGELSIGASPCGVSVLPADVVIDLDEDAEQALREQLRIWISGEGMPGLDPSRGTLFAKSEDDAGRSPPHPTWVGRNAERACGTHQKWLRAHALRLLARHAPAELGSDLRCSENVCCYDAPMEYSSSGTFVFAPADGGHWTLRAVVEIADNRTMGDEWVDAERAWVTEQLAGQVRGRCAGEPTIAW